MTARHQCPGRMTSRLIRAIGDAVAPRGKGKGRLCILSYHRVLEERDPFLDQEPCITTFRWQMELLAECFNVLPLHEAVAALATDRMPPRAVCITFDDGYRSIHDYALPVLKEFRLPATVFVSSGYVNQTNMWNDRIMKAMETLPAMQLDLQSLGVGIGRYSLDTVRDRSTAIHKVIESLKYRSPGERDELTSRIEDMVGEKPVDSLMLTRDMVLDLSRHGVEIGGHTVSHPILSSLDDDIAYAEMVNGKRQLEEIIGRPVRLFAYPNGKHGIDFDERHMRMAKEIGFAAAFTTAFGPATGTDDRYALPRSRPWDAKPSHFAFRLLSWLAGRY